jgi:hypothetical protein
MGSLVFRIAGSGGGVTAASNLVHWWKMNEGSTTSATDYGEDAESGTNLTMSGVTAVTGGGPSALSSPNHVLTSDYNDIIYTKTSNGSTKTVVGDFFDNDGGISVCMWLKIPNTQNSTTFWDVSINASKNSGCGMDFRQYGGSTGDTLWAWFENNAGTGTFTPGHGTNPNIHWQADVGTGWAHWAFTYPQNGQAKIYINGSLVYTYGSQTPVNTALATSPTLITTAFALGGSTRWVDGGTRLAPYAFADASFSDVRLYDKELSSSEVSDISDGDW